MADETHQKWKALYAGVHVLPADENLDTDEITEGSALVRTALDARQLEEKSSDFQKQLALFRVPLVEER
jgi:hypothetical protein